MAIVANKARFSGIDTHISAPKNVGAPEYVFTVTPSDADVLPYTIRAIWVDVTGSVVVSYKGRTATYTITAGDWYAVKADKVLSTGTTATGIKGGR